MSFPETVDSWIANRALAILSEDEDLRAYARGGVQDYELENLLDIGATALVVPHVAVLLATQTPVPRNRLHLTGLVVGLVTAMGKARGTGGFERARVVGHLMRTLWAARESFTWTPEGASAPRYTFSSLAFSRQGPPRQLAGSRKYLFTPLALEVTSYECLQEERTVL
ncbi:MAG: hypothetical protein AAGD06_21120 [Acidobacteriota bacterium]